MRPRYCILTNAWALATTSKTALLIIPGANTPIRIVEFGVSIDAATGRILVELVESTQAVAGTSTGTGAKQIGGYVSGSDGTPSATYGREYSVEPTVLTVLKKWWCPAPGPIVIQFPLGREPESLVSGSTNHKALGLRMKADSGTPACDSYLEWEE